MYRNKQGALAAIAVATAGMLVSAGHADTPVLSATYGWEDGKGTILSSFNGLGPADNVGSDGGVDPNTGNRMLRLNKPDGEESAPHAYVAFIEGLQDGDVVSASFFAYDDTIGQGNSGYPSVRIWASYARSGDIDDFAGSIPQSQQNQMFTSGIGWEQIGHSWTFNSNNGDRDALRVEVRIYSNDDDTNFYIDDLQVHVYCAANPDLTITLPGGTVIDDPASPGPECGACTPDLVAGYGWEDEVATVFGFNGNLTQIENTGPVGKLEPNSGDRMLRVRQGNSSGTPRVFLAFIENLNHGDEIYASFFAYDDTPGSGTAGYPSYRIYAHYGISGNPNTVLNQAGGGAELFSSGIGWEEIGENWVFDDGGGTRDALMIQARFYTNVDDTDFFLDDVFVSVCSSNPSVSVRFPNDTEPPDDPCEVPNGTPSLSGTFDWEDGTSTILGYDFDGQEFITAANIASPAPVHTGLRGLRVTESPHGSGTPAIFLAYIEHLQNGDVIHGRFHTYDTVPGTTPRVRIWGRRVFSGDVNSQPQSLSGNETYSSGTGWEELCHTWVFDGGPGDRDAMVIEARIYSPNPGCEECSSDYYFDDMEVLLFANPNATITFADGVVIGDPPLICPADINGSGGVDVFDLFTVLGAWGTSDPSADINNDGIVDGLDLGILLASWGPCSKPYLAPVQGSVDLVVNTTALRSGMNKHDIYVQLNNAGDALVNVYDANVNFSGTFDSSSFIAIGQQSFNVVEDPNFDTFQFAFGLGIGDDAGWYNENPTNNLGLAGSYANNQVLIASFTMDEAENATGTLSVTYENADGRPVYATASFDTADTGTPCVGDLNNDNAVNVSDLLLLFGAWGPCPGCAADLNGDNVVNVSDLLLLFGAWGACP